MLCMQVVRRQSHGPRVMVSRVLCRCWVVLWTVTLSLSCGAALMGSTDRQTIFSQESSSVDLPHAISVTSQISSLQGNYRDDSQQPEVPAVRLKGCPSQLYTFPLQVGENKYDVAVDTGSSTLVLMGHECIGCNIAGAAAYVPGKDAKDLGMVRYARYGAGGLYGPVYLDLVSVPNHAVPDVTAPVPLAVTSVHLQGIAPMWQSCSNYSSRVSLTGILGLGLGGGLGFSDMAESFLEMKGLGRVGEEIVVKGLIKAGMSPNFAVQLCDLHGYLWFGNVNRNHIPSGETVQFVDITPSVADWEANTLPYKVTIDGMLLGGQKLDLGGNETSRHALVDTGDPYFYVPRAALTGFAKARADALADAGDVYDLSYPKDLPECVLGLPHDHAVIDTLFPSFTLSMAKRRDGTGGSLKLEVSASRSYMVPHPWIDNTTLWCWKLRSEAGNVGTIGTPLMRSFILVFDIGPRKRIGFAPQNFDTCNERVPAVPGPTPAPPAGSHGGWHTWPWWAKYLLVMGVLLGAGLLALGTVVFRGWLHRRYTYASVAEGSADGGTLLQMLLGKEPEAGGV